MSRSGFLNKVPEQRIFRGATRTSLVMVMLLLMPIAAIVVSSIFKGDILPLPHP